MAAFRDDENRVCGVRMADDGVVLSRIRDGVKRPRLFVSNQNRGTEEGRCAEGAGGTARFSLDPFRFTTLLGVP
jgi:hypothetical protein